MSLHSYTKCWFHLIWATHNRDKILSSSEMRKKVSECIYDYSESKKIYMKINYVNAEHVHALIDLPTKYSIEEVFKLIKGGTSHEINSNNIIENKISWGRGYAAFSVSHSNIDKVVKYIMSQGEHHKIKSFSKEYEEFIKAYGLQYFQE